MATIKVKRVYDEPAAADGQRVLVDRIWPRGLTRERARVDVWLKEIAPTTTLRKWFGHEPSRWQEFQKRYRAELDHHSAPVEQLRALSDQGLVTLLFGARDIEHNNAVALANYLHGAHT